MQKFIQTFPDIIKKDIPLSRHSSFRIGGPADYAAFPRTKEEFISLLALTKKENIRSFVAGNGTNLLFDDAGFRGLVIFTTAMKSVRWEENAVTAEAGASLTALAGEAAKRGLSGLEFAYGIPGTVGGAVYMNAGAYGGEIADLLTESTYFDGEKTAVLDLPSHRFSYRHSVYKENSHTILSARFSLMKSTAEEVTKKSEGHLSSRKEKQPLDFPSAGSTFKRPEGYFAAALIDQCGLKGYAVGGAMVSEKHAGFVINRGGATAHDVRALMEHIQNEVQKSFSVPLEPEIIFVPAEG